MEIIAAGFATREPNMIRARQSKAAPVGVVGKVLLILDALANSSTGLQLRQIAQETGIHPSTAYRFLAHLESAGYLFRDDGGAYVVGPRLARFGAGQSFHATLRKVSRPVLHSVWRTTEETVNLAVVDGHDMLFLDVIESAHSFRTASRVGMRRPVNCTSLGKAVLAFLPRDEQEEMLSSMTFVRATKYTIPDSARLRKDLAKTRRQGFALDEQETDLGARCVAAPILDASGNVLAALSVSGPITRITPEKIPLFSALVKRATRDIASRLSGANGDVLKSA
jgi:DNA-binding IclR family transcriptional regulator